MLVRRIINKLFLAFILVVSSATYSPAQQSSFFVIDDFSKMLAGHKSPYLTEKSPIDVLNVRANEQYGSLVKRPVLYTVASCHASAVTSLYRYYKSDATKYSLATNDAYIDYISDAGVCQTLSSSETSGKTWTWLTYKDIAIGMSGYDRPVKWDGKTTITADTTGARTAGEVVTELGAPFAELLTGTDLDASSWYQYKVAYFDGTNYSYSTARSNPIQTGATVYNITLTDIPLGPTGTTARSIYRTLGNATKAAVLADTTYYLVHTISDNSTRTLIDNHSDSTIDDDASPKWSTVSGGINATPPYARFLYLHKERLWAGNDPSGTTYGKSTVYFSSLLNPDHWLASSNYFLIRPDDGDDVSFIKSFLGYLFIGKTNSISQISTNDTSTSNWQLFQPVSFIGCLAPYSAAESQVGIIYLGKAGLYKFDGQSSKLISDIVTNEVKDINPVATEKIVGVFYNNEYRLAYPTLSIASAINNRVLIFDFIRDSYVKDSESIGAWAVYGSASDYGTLFSGSSDVDGKVMAHGKAPDALTFRYQSEINAGTTDSVLVTGTEEDPVMELGWGITIDSVTVATVTIDSVTYDTATVNIPSDTGYWWSDSYQVNATALQKLYWNEDLGLNGNVTFSARTASTEAALASASWSAELDDPSGSDLSAITANNWIQFRATLSTSDTAYTPYLIIVDNFMIKMAYSKAGTLGETAFLSFWKSGWIPLSSDLPQNPKLVQEIDVYYEGTAGIVNFKIENLKGDVVGSFDIDLSLGRLATQQYYGRDTSKVFRYNTPSVPTVANYLFGDKFRLTITETGTTQWKIQRLVIRYAPQEYTPYR